MAKYFLIRFSYDKVVRNDSVIPIFQLAVAKKFVQGKTFDHACLKLSKRYAGARMFRDLTVKPKTELKFKDHA